MIYNGISSSVIKLGIGILSCLWKFDWFYTVEFRHEIV